MTRLWWRLRRLWFEPRIRLPAPRLKPDELAPGDRLQIGSQLWRIEAPSAEDPATLELTRADGPDARARLRLVTGRWTLATESGVGSAAVEVNPAAMIHFPVSVDFER